MKKASGKWMLTRSSCPRHFVVDAATGQQVDCVGKYESSTRELLEIPSFVEAAEKYRSIPALVDFGASLNLLVSVDKVKKFRSLLKARGQLSSCEIIEVEPELDGVEGDAPPSPKKQRTEDPDASIEWEI